MWADLIQWVEGLSLSKGWAREFALCLTVSHLEPSSASELSLELHHQFSWFSVLGISWTPQFMNQPLKIIPFSSLWHSCISGQTHTLPNLFRILPFPFVFIFLIIRWIFKGITDFDTIIKNITGGLRVPFAHFPSMILSHKAVVQLQLFIYLFIFKLLSKYF